MVLQLGEIAAQIGAQLQGDPDVEVEDIAPLHRATAQQLSFLSSSKFADHLQSTAAIAVILHPDQQAHFSGNCLLMADPYLGYARAAALFHPFEQKQQGIHPSATVDPTATIAADAWIGPQSVVMANVEIEPSVYIGPGCVVASGSKVGRNSRLMGNVSLMEDTVVGESCIIHAGAVLGSDGFGFANDGGKWIKIPQLGRVVVGDRVEIGANTTIDRGALEDTLIGDGVKLDNLVHIAHNVQVGEDCAMAAMVGVAGSTKIAPNCTFGGQAGVVGHLEIVAGTHCTARTLVTHSIHKAGVYSSATTADENRKWRRNSVQFKKLNESVQRLRRVEQKIKQLDEREEDE
ncbi:MAG: UDP-3-O-(3-hydroxymyristoyl)glucosamine N-acyltransferase [Gammaproteobacteria bacterium]|nr:UDP-3-O-(3-hydroxymyristoyl)glucosamine N-acyltransferase [Gammaproteobacteria bacterium]